jgi:adenine phosphoribosyltransferase
MASEDSIELASFIRSIPDFPHDGILFRDITPLLRSPEAFAYSLDCLQTLIQPQTVDAIVGIESRGFLFGSPLADRLKVPFVPVRKPGKLPAARMSVEYSLEYGTSQLDIHSDSLSRGDRVVIIDDLLATGGTARAAAKLVELLRAGVVRMLFVIELTDLHGREFLDGYDVHSLLQY